ncbi:CarD family transcriptional regulator [Taibaiella sp. KBW10]|uniref:Crp/Fnr family transcriptional regulator n=1 Tax=Taibaiella sp. KBW10 TaxID=2153357 RepID=UPI000F5ADC52|nr:Crp/Fnr family transcriptional regulator [Taibaiella sp. KBW10]RQO32456.1 CarD family transcriptional regulator [Taibaiella sp. KBW10]
MPENWRKHFNNINAVSEEDWALLNDKLTKTHFRKKDVILKYGEIENHISFVNKGIVKYTYLKENVNVSFNFFFPDTAFCAYDSFLLRRPSIFQIQAVTDVEILRVSFDDLDKIYQQSSIGNLIGRKIAESIFISKIHRELSLLSEDAEGRYRRIYKEWPELLTAVPLKDVASYIGITPQALSRIRKSFSEQIS